MFTRRCMVGHLGANSSEYFMNRRVERVVRRGEGEYSIIYNRSYDRIEPPPRSRMTPQSTGIMFLRCILQRASLQGASFATIPGNDDRHQAKYGSLAT